MLRWKLKCKHNSSRFSTQTINYARRRKISTALESKKFFYLHKRERWQRRERQQNGFRLHHRSFLMHFTRNGEKFYDFIGTCTHMSATERASDKFRSPINRNLFAQTRPHVWLKVELNGSRWLACQSLCNEIWCDCLLIRRMRVVEQQQIRVKNLIRKHKA